MHLRILHISTRLILGGSQENTILSCESQARAGHDVHLAFGPIYGPEGSMLGRVEAFNQTASAAGDTAPITTHLVPAMVRELSPWKDFKAYRHLRAMIWEIAPDVVHTHSSKAGILGRAAAWSLYQRNSAAGRALPAVVHTVHGPPFHAHEKAWRNRLYIAAERWAARRCHKIVSVADAMTRQFLEAGIARPQHYTTVRSGIDLAVYECARAYRVRQAARQELAIPAEHIVLGTVARLTDLKGHDDIIDALAPLLLARPDVRLLWVGDGWRRARLTQRLIELGIRDRVVMTGLVDPERVPAMLSAMDVLLHPSYREGLPRCVVQAMAMAIPVVATDADGTAEVVEDQITGRLVKIADTPALRAAVEWMLGDADRRTAIGEAGRARVVPAFGAARMVTDLERVYEEAMRCAHEHNQA